MTDRIPPHNLEAEESVLGSMILDSPARIVAQELLVANDFYSENHRHIFRAIAQLDREKSPVDHVTLANELKERGRLDEVGNMAYLIKLTGDTPNAGNIQHYAQIVWSCASRRDAIDNAHRIATAAEVGEDYKIFIEALESRIDPGRPVLKTTTAFDLQHIEFPPLTYVVDKLLPAGLCFFAGAFKAGKSWMALQLSLAVSRGDPFFGEPTTQGEVLAVAVEDNDRRLQNRIGNLCKDEWPDTLHLATSIRRLDNGGIEELERFKRDHPDLRLVILDIWQRVRGKERSRNAYADDYSAIEDIQSFASDHEVAVLVLHHHRKSPDADPFNKFSGSTGIMGSSDTLWSLERERGQCDASFITTGRDIKEMELALTFNEDTCEWTALGPLLEYAHSIERSKIIRVLKESDTAMGPKEIAGALDKNESTTRALLRKMLEAGEIEKVGRGEYVPKETITIADFKEDN